MICEYKCDTEKGKACPAYCEFDSKCTKNPRDCTLKPTLDRFVELGRLDLIMDTPSLGKNAEIEGGL